MEPIGPTCGAEFYIPTAPCINPRIKSVKKARKNDV